MSDIRIHSVSGRGILPWLDALAELRIRVFRDFPYLYDGSLDYERVYLSEYADSARSVIVVATDGEQVVGCSTGLPMADADPEFQRPFVAAGFPLETIFYFGESVLDAAYRGRGLGHRFFDEREAHARKQGFRLAAFCAVERPADHPLRPADYRPLDAFWEKRGYHKRPELTAQFAWKDVDQPDESRKTLVFRLRSLEPDGRAGPP